MQALELKIPPVAVFLLCAAGMWMLKWLNPAWSFSFPGRRLLAVVVACTGAAIGVAGVLAFRSARTTVDPRYPVKSSAFVRTGIYRRTRNPMYLGLLLLLLAWLLYLAHAPALVGLPLFMFYMNRFQILPEERAMQSGFGDDYRRYLMEVRRWL